MSSSLDAIANLATQYLSAHEAAQGIHTTNVANADTPGFKAKVPHFRTVLDRTAQASGRPSLKYELRVGNSNAAEREDGNNVKLDQEMAAIAANGMQYMTAIRILSKEFAMAQYAATQGGR